MPEPKDTQEMLSDEGRGRIANRLRFIADRLQEGVITPDSFDLQPEWIDVPPRADGLRDQKPTGRIFVRLDYWTTVIEKL